jgi:hypothetical protein
VRWNADLQVGGGEPDAARGRGETHQSKGDTDLECRVTRNGHLDEELFAALKKGLSGANRALPSGGHQMLPGQMRRSARPLAARAGVVL